MATANVNNLIFSLLNIDKSGNTFTSNVAGAEIFVSDIFIESPLDDLSVRWKIIENNKNRLAGFFPRYSSIAKDLTGFLIGSDALGKLIINENNSQKYASGNGYINTDNELRVRIFRDSGVLKIRYYHRVSSGSTENFIYESLLTNNQIAALFPLHVKGYFAGAGATLNNLTLEDDGVAPSKIKAGETLFRYENTVSQKNETIGIQSEAAAVAKKNDVRMPEIPKSIKQTGLCQEWRVPVAGTVKTGQLLTSGLIGAKTAKFNILLNDVSIFANETEYPTINQLNKDILINKEFPVEIGDSVKLVCQQITAVTELKYPNYLRFEIEN